MRLVAILLERVLSLPLHKDVFKFPCNAGIMALSCQDLNELNPKYLQSVASASILALQTEGGVKVALEFKANGQLWEHTMAIVTLASHSWYRSPATI